MATSTTNHKPNPTLGPPPIGGTVVPPLGPAGGWILLGLRCAQRPRGRAGGVCAGQHGAELGRHQGHV